LVKWRASVLEHDQPFGVVVVVVVVAVGASAEHAAYAFL
jgi:hypothetical protein